MALRTVGVRLVAEIADYQRKMGDAATATRKVAGEMDRAAKGGGLDQLADQATALGVGLVGVAGYAVKMSADFEKAMSGVKAATHASGAELELLRKAALQAGKDSQYSATEAANAITELSKAGVSSADVLGGGLKGALDLAAAGQMDVADAAETAASAMVQFSLKGKDVPHIADLLAAGAGKAQGSVGDLGYALKQGGLVAAQFGLSVEDTVGALAQFANAGLTGSDAGTSFKTMLLAMANPSGVTAKKMQELGISFYDAEGRFIGLSGVAEELRDKLAHLTEEERNAALGQIYGSDAIRAATILYRDGAKGVQEWRDKVNDAGYAADTAAALTDNLIGDLERLKGTLETSAIESGGGLNSGLRIIVQSTEAVVETMGKLPPIVTGTATALTALGGVLLLAGAGWVKMRRSNAEALEELRATGPAGTRAAAGLERTQRAAGRVALAFGGITVASSIISSTFGTELNPQVGALADSLDHWSKSGERSGEAARLLGDDFGNLRYDLGTLGSGLWDQIGNGIAGTIEWFSGMGDVADQSLTKAKERIQALDGALAQMVGAGQMDEAQALFNRLAQEGKAAGISVSDLKKGLPQYAAAVQTAGTQTEGTAEALEGMAGEADSASGAAMSLSEAMDKLFQEQMSSDRAALKLAQSTNDLAEELSRGTRTLNVNTAEGRKNRAAVLDQLEAIEATRDARVRGGETMEKANKLYLKDIDGLKSIARQAGFTEKQIDELTGAYEDIPNQVKTKVSSTGVPAVERQLDRLMVYQQALKKGIIPAGFHGPIKGEDGRYYHDGGHTGPGDEWQPAGVVHAGEWVIKKSSVEKIERTNPGLLSEMNATGNVPGRPAGFRAGGSVDWPYRTTASKTRIPSREEVAKVVMPVFDSSGWPSSPSAQRGDSGVWRKVKQFLEQADMGGSFGNGYRPGDPLWHGSGRAVDWMGYNLDRLATRLAGMRPLELIHRTKNRDYAYTRGVNKGSFNNSLMEAHRNHVHIAMQNGGMIREPVFGVGQSGATYSFGENYMPERVVPAGQTGGGGSGTVIEVGGITINAPVGSSPREIGRQVADVLDSYCRGGGRVTLRGVVSA